MPSHDRTRSEPKSDTGDSVVQIGERLVVQAVREVCLERADEGVTQTLVSDDPGSPDLPIGLGVGVAGVERYAELI